jgi:tetratricopeptide (TPR) repeat protein
MTSCGPDHPDTAMSLNNLAELYRSQGRYDEAEPMYKRALEIYEKALETDHPDVATFLENMSFLYKKLNRNAEAEQCIKRAQEIRSKQKK